MDAEPPTPAYPFSDRLHIPVAFAQPSGRDYRQLNVERAAERLLLDPGVRRVGVAR